MGVARYVGDEAPNGNRFRRRSGQTVRIGRFYAPTLSADFTAAAMA